VGFTVRGQREVGAGTRLEMLTPGVLLRRLLADPELPGVAAVLLDEVHERSLETDLLLGMLAEARQLREDLLVGAMSATLDAAAVAAVLEEAAIVEVPSARHELSVSHAPSPPPRRDARGITREHLHRLARTPAPPAGPRGPKATVGWCSGREPGRSTRSSPACRGSSGRRWRCSRCTGGCPPRSRTAPRAGGAPARRRGSWSPPPSRRAPSPCRGCTWWSMQACPARCAGTGAGTCRGW